ncbi:MAG TPA: O-antigen ligase family protein [Polyangiaceae bacterium]|nr:O-antigen ligase family protein [Polyangiaceae bacterium]
MSERAFEVQPAEPRQTRFALFVAALGVATVASAILLGPLFALLPLGAWLGLVALSKLPLRVPLMVMMFIGLTFENPGDVPADGKWKSPLYSIGKLLLSQLKHSIPNSALVMTGSDLILALLVCIYFYRRVAGSDLDRRGLVPTPRPLVWAAIGCVAVSLAMWLWGVARGGQNRFALWQFHHINYLPVMFLFMQVAIPGNDKWRGFARLVVAAACVKAVLAICLRHALPLNAYVTTHHDSMLFATATCLVLAQTLEKPSARTVVRNLSILLLLVMGMLANDRRLVWAQIGLAVIFMFVLARRTKLKVFVTRCVLFSLPVLLLYVAVGWNSGSGVFAPVGTLRSMADSQANKSSEWRDLENFNLVATVKSHPLAGAGFGHPFEMAVELPDVVSEYELEPYLPHNSVLGIWAYTGYIGFSLIWMMLALTMYFAARAYRYAIESDDRIAALTSFCVVVIYMVHCYGDMALGTWTSIYLVSLAMVVAGKVAVKVGAWPDAVRAQRPRVVAVPLPLRRLHD